MKRKLLIGLSCFAVMAAAATATVSTINANTQKLSGLMLTNLQILARGEEVTNVDDCSVRKSGAPWVDSEWALECSSDTKFDHNGKVTAIAPCPSLRTLMMIEKSTLCTKP